MLVVKSSVLSVGLCCSFTFQSFLIWQMFTFVKSSISFCGYAQSIESIAYSCNMSTA